MDAVLQCCPIISGRFSQLDAHFSCRFPEFGRGGGNFFEKKQNKSCCFQNVFNFLFARTFYNLEKNISKLADLLGHSSIETTRIYIMESGAEHERLLNKMHLKLKEKELKALLARDEELDGLFERIYEDNVSGKISDERFSRMSRRYEDEQKELTEKIKQLRSEIEKQSSRTMTTDMFISLVRKYTRAKKLTPRMLNELVEKIEVFNAEKVNGVWEQRLRIHYNCVGTIEIPSALPLPTPDVSVNTRKGVVVNYAPCDVAI